MQKCLCVGMYVSILLCWHICRHLDMSTYWPAQEQIFTHTHIYIYVAIFLTTSRMCRHLNVLACMSASCCFGIYIYVGIGTCQYICHRVATRSGIREKSGNLILNFQGREMVRNLLKHCLGREMVGNSLTMRISVS